MTETRAWFALTSKPRHEKAAAENLRAKGLESFVPVDLPLFPGYVFCRFAYASRLPVLNTPGVTSVVSFSDAPAPVADDEISRIRTIQASGLPSQPWPYVRVGQRARIEWGALAGLEGVLIREKDALRVVVSVELLRRAVAVEIDRDMIRAVKGAEHASMAYVYLTNQAKASGSRRD
jgi:transcription antitermination factor NusG